MKNANEDLNRFRQPNVLPFSASWRCYPSNLGLNVPPDWHVAGCRNWSLGSKGRCAIELAGQSWFT